jgi:glutathione S-transferase
LGQLPILEMEGKRIFQSIPICRLLAKKFKLTGKDEEDSTKCDIAVETINDLRSGNGFICDLMHFP